MVRRAGSGSYVQHTAPVTSFQFGLLIPELGSTEIFEPICKGIMQSPQAKSHSLIWGHTAQKGASKEEAALCLCRQFIEQKVSGVFFAPLEFVDQTDSINHQLVAELRQAGIPIVLLDRCYYTYPMRSNLDRVGIDNHRASFVLHAAPVESGRSTYCVCGPQAFGFYHRGPGVGIPVRTKRVRVAISCQSALRRCRKSGVSPRAGGRGAA